MVSRDKQFIEERHALILKLLKESGRVTVQDLCRRFSVSVATARSDLDQLQRLGIIRRTHGGALAAEQDVHPIPFSTRQKYYGSEKKAIGRAAVRLVKDGEVIFIDGGTTAAQMRLFLTDKNKLTVITPSLEIAYWLSSTPLVNVYLLNGFLNRDSLSLVGPPAEETIVRMNISRAFCGAAGFTLQDGLTDLDMGFVEQKRIICKLARKVVGLVDHTKIGVTSLASFASLEQIETLVTDRPLPKDMLPALQEHGIQLIVARSRGE
jgi:DeoR/GlpR family transcriptional regulator of sugar metabolism